VATKKVVIAGAFGLVGRGAVEHMDALNDWEVVGLSRRKPDFESGASFVSVDLMDRAATEKTLGSITGVTHAVYTALYEKSELAAGWTAQDQVDTNVEMFKNFLEVLTAANPNLEHITLMQGTKAYGVHTGSIRIPSRESDARILSPGFYYGQEDMMKECQKGTNWTWTILRPQMVCGIALGTQLSVTAGVGVYAAISRELGLPLRFPGRSDGLLEAVDNMIIAKAMVWAAINPQCANQAYNLTNGDSMVWQNLFPKVAKLFNMESAEDHAVLLKDAMRDKAPLWEQMVEKYGLTVKDMNYLVGSWDAVDLFFDYGVRDNPAVLSTIKARKHGFHECEDTEDMFIRMLTDMQDRNLLPR
jgi:nucleoside-diphosphate-sugar epimerase